MFKNFFKEKFNIAIFLSTGVILLLILLFIFLNLSSKTHVRFVQIDGGQESAEINNNQIKVFFSGPMNKDSSDRFINIDPSVEFSTAWSNNTLFITLHSNLSSSTEYNLTISNKMADIYGEPLGEDFTYTFVSEDLSLAFLQSESETKKVILSDPNLDNFKELYQSPYLKLFDLNDEFLAVVERIDDLDNLKLINLRTGFIKDFNLKSVVIDKIDFSPIDNKFIYISQKVNPQNGYNILSGEVEMKIYDIDSDQTTLLNPGQTLVQTVDVKFSPDGGSILYKTGDGYFNLMPLNNTNDVVQLGRFLAEGGFNGSGNKVVFIGFDAVESFTEYQFIVQLNADRSQKKITDGSNGVLDPRFYNNEESILYAEKYKELESTKGLYRIVKYMEDGDIEEVLSDSNESLELPIISPDDRYIAIEKYTASSLLNFENQRNFLFQTKPDRATLIVYDLLEKMVINKDISGIDARWIY